MTRLVKRDVLSKYIYSHFKIYTFKNILLACQLKCSLDICKMYMARSQIHGFKTFEIVLYLLLNMEQKVAKSDCNGILRGFCAVYVCMYVCLSTAAYM